MPSCALWETPGGEKPGRKEVETMISANISKQKRRYIYRREGFQCALCGSTKYLQIHHLIHRSVGGSDHEHNLICLCADCHALAHGINLFDFMPELTPDDITHECTVYLADMYAPHWNPWTKEGHPYKERRI